MKTPPKACVSATVLCHVCPCSVRATTHERSRTADFRFSFSIHHLAFHPFGRTHERSWARRCVSDCTRIEDFFFLRVGTSAFGYAGSSILSLFFLILLGWTSRLLLVAPNYTRSNACASSSSSSLGCRGSRASIASTSAVVPVTVGLS